MTPAELKTIRRTLGLSQRELAERLQLGKHGERTVRRWEIAERDIPGPVVVLLQTWSAQGVQR